MGRKKMCRHHRSQWIVGPRLPLRWGSAATIVCSACGSWRDERVWKPSTPGWRPASELLLAVCPTDADDDPIAYRQKPDQ